MADNVAITAGTGTTIAADEVTDGTLGSVKVQYVKIMDGTLDGTTKAAVSSTGLAVTPSGNVADDAVDSGNPLKLGAVAKSFDGTTPGSVSAEDDRTNLIADLNRRTYVNAVHPFFYSTNNNYSSAQTNVQQKAAPGASLSLFVTDVIFSTDAVLNFKLVEDTGGTPATIAGPYYFAANSGMAKHFSTPIRVSTNKNLGFTSVGSSNHTITICGFTAPS